MKKFLLCILVVVCSISGHSQTDWEMRNCFQINFRVGIIDKPIVTRPRPRTPIQAPEAGLDGHTLYLAEGHPACTLLIMVADEEAVYEVEVPEGVDVVELPATLTGTYELQLYYEDSNFYFYSEIELL